MQFLTQIIPLIFFALVLTHKPNIFVLPINHYFHVVRRYGFSWPIRAISPIKFNLSVTPFLSPLHIILAITLILSCGNFSVKFLHAPLVNKSFRLWFAMRQSRTFDTITTLLFLSVAFIYRSSL